MLLRPSPPTVLALLTPLVTPRPPLPVSTHVLCRARGLHSYPTAGSQRPEEFVDLLTNPTNRHVIFPHVRGFTVLKQNFFSYFQLPLKCLLSTTLNYLMDPKAKFGETLLTNKIKCGCTWTLHANLSVLVLSCREIKDIVKEENVPMSISISFKYIE